jgi:hypothetical protein
LAKVKRKIFDFFPKGRRNNNQKPTTEATPSTEDSAETNEASQPVVAQDDPNEKIFKELAWIREAYALWVP